MLQVRIRDLLLAMTIIGIASGWYVSYYKGHRQLQNLSDERVAVIRQAQELRVALKQSKTLHDQLDAEVRNLHLHPPLSRSEIATTPRAKVNWEVLNKPLPAP